MLAEDRRVLTPRKRALLLAGFHTGQHADITARKQGFETGDVAGEEPRLDHPEHGCAGQQRCRLVGRGDGDDDVVMIGRERHALDGAKYDVLELELRLTRLQPLRGVEGDGDRRSFFGQGVPGEISAASAASSPAPEPAARIDWSFKNSPRGAVARLYPFWGEGL